MPFVPRGLESQKHPLKHRFFYSFGLNGSNTAMNSVWCGLVRNSSAVNNPNTIKVNPHNTDLDQETGMVCSPMSIIENMRLNISLIHTQTDLNVPFKISMTPFFCSFGEKYDAADDDTGTTVAGIMQLTKDDTNEDVVPLTTNNLPVVGNSDALHPVSTVNLTEGFADLNMTADLIMEDTPFSMSLFSNLIANGTNRGALKACLGRTRRWTFDRNHQSYNLNLKKFVPKPIRRIVPFTFFGLLFNMPTESEPDSFYHSIAVSSTLAHIGVKVMVRYDEWNESHDNTMVAV